MEKYIYRKLEWDTEYFECLSSRIDIINTLDKNDFQKIRELIEKDNFITITNSNRMMKNNAYISNELGAYLVDINVQLISNTFEKVVKDKEYISIYNNYSSNSKILNLVSKAFVYSRFYNDIFLNKQEEKISGVYTNWVMNSFYRNDKYFCIYEEENILKGFVLFKPSKNRDIVIELISVDEKYQNDGIGSELINSVYNFCLKNKYNNIFVGTQLENIKALNFYIKNSFRLKEIKYIYHLWNIKEK